jgi:L,D-transpeptidase-like protein
VCSTIALLVGLAVVARTSREARTDTALARAVAGLPRPPRPAFEVGRPVLLDEHESRARFAPVDASVDALAAPSGDAPVVARLGQNTPEGTTNIVLVLDEVSRAGRVWVHVRLPVLPNGRTAWVRRSALGGYRFVRTHLVVSRARLTATLFYDRRPVFRAPVGIGTADAPTPSGKFYVRDRVAGFDDPFYGPVAFGTSARSEVLTDWPAGAFVGIHGTNSPELIPGRVSHGCIRMRNTDILRLSRLMPVGTPLTIE